MTTDEGQACTAEPTGELGHTANGITELVPTKRVRLGTGAVHVDLFTSSAGADGVDMPVAQFPAKVDFLDGNGERCEPTQAVDGTLRCAPVSLGAYRSGYSPDAACKGTLYASDSLGFESASLRAAVQTRAGILAGIATVKPYDGPVYGINNGGTCVRENVAPGSLLQVDQSVDISALPKVTEATL